MLSQRTAWCREDPPHIRLPEVLELFFRDTEEKHTVGKNWGFLQLGLGKLSLFLNISSSIYEVP